MVSENNTGERASGKVCDEPPSRDVFQKQLPACDDGERVARIFERLDALDRAGHQRKPVCEVRRREEVLDNLDGLLIGAAPDLAEAVAEEVLGLQGLGLCERIRVGVFVVKLGQLQNELTQNLVHVHGYDTTHCTLLSRICEREGRRLRAGNADLLWVRRSAEMFQTRSGRASGSVRLHSSRAHTWPH